MVYRLSYQWLPDGISKPDPDSECDLCNYRKAVSEVEKIKLCISQMKNLLGLKKSLNKNLEEDEFNKMTNKQLFESATKLITLMEVVYKHQNSPNNKEGIDKAFDVLFNKTLKIK